jgi:pimeloyl-ACP methyl ester carboxylesterase
VTIALPPRLQPVLQARHGLERYVPDLTFIEVDEGTHWLAEERPTFVNQTIREHLERVARPVEERRPTVARR